MPTAPCLTSVLQSMVFIVATDAADAPADSASSSSATSTLRRIVSVCARGAVGELVLCPRGSDGPRCSDRETGYVGVGTRAVATSTRGERPIDGGRERAARECSGALVVARCVDGVRMSKCYAISDACVTNVGTSTFVPQSGAAGLGGAGAAPLTPPSRCDSASGGPAAGASARVGAARQVRPLALTRTGHLEASAACGCSTSIHRRRIALISDAASLQRAFTLPIRPPVACLSADRNAPRTRSRGLFGKSLTVVARVLAPIGEARTAHRGAETH